MTEKKLACIEYNDLLNYEINAMDIDLVRDKNKFLRLIKLSRQILCKYTFRLRRKGKKILWVNLIYETLTTCTSILNTIDSQSIRSIGMMAIDWS